MWRRDLAQRAVGRLHREDPLGPAVALRMIRRDHEEAIALRRPGHVRELPRRGRQEARGPRRDVDEEEARPPVVAVDDARVVLLLVARLLRLALGLLREVGDLFAVGRPRHPLAGRLLPRDADRLAAVGRHHPELGLLLAVGEKGQPLPIGR